MGGIQYNSAPGTMTAILDFIQTDGSYFYEYDLKDHLGNTRVTVKQSGTNPAAGTADVIQEDSFYAFGNYYVLAIAVIG